MSGNNSDTPFKRFEVTSLLVDTSLNPKKLTERAVQTLGLAHNEAISLNHNYLGTEHLLLGLLREGGGVAAKVLQDFGVELGAAREAVENTIGRGNEPSKSTPLSIHAKGAIQHSVKEAARHQHDFIGTEHLLLGLLAEGESVGLAVLLAFDVTVEQVWARVEQILTTKDNDSFNLPQAVAKLRDTITGGKTTKTAKDNVITCRVDARSLEAIDGLIDAGICTTRSEAAGWLISAGVEANQPLFQKVNSAVGEIRRLREEAWQVIQNGPPQKDA